MLCKGSQAKTIVNSKINPKAASTNFLQTQIFTRDQIYFYRTNKSTYMILNIIKKCNKFSTINFSPKTIRDDHLKEPYLDTTENHSNHENFLNLWLQLWVINLDLLESFRKSV